MLLLHAGDLLAEVFRDQRVGVLRGCVGDGVVDGVYGEEKIVGGEVGVEANGAEVFADVLRGAGEGLGNAGGKTGGGEQFGAVLRGPEVEQASDS